MQRISWYHSLLFVGLVTTMSCSSGGGPTGASPGLVIALAPDHGSGPQSGSVAFAAAATGTGGFTGAASFAVTGLPAGVTAAVSNVINSGAVTTATILVTIGAAAVPGSSTLTVTASGAGVTAASTPYALTVTGPSGGGSNVTLNFTGCGAFLTPVWLAFQDGNGAWTRVTPTGAVYQFNIASAKGGWAFAAVSGANSTVAVNLVTKAEIAGAPVVFCPPTVLKTVNVTVTGLSATDVAFLALGGASGFATSSTLAPIGLAGVQSGLQDLVAYRTPILGGPTAGDRAIIVRDLNIANNGSAGTLDFAGGTLITPAAATITVAGLQAGDAMSGSMAYYTGAQASCTVASLYSIPSSAAAARILYGIPAASQRATDFHSVSFTEINGNTTRSILQSFHSLVSQTITLGVNLPTPTVTSLAQAGYKRLQAVVTVPADYPTSAQLLYTQQGTGKSASLVATLGWLGGTAATLTFPDFSAVSGWDNSWVAAPGSTVDWTVLANDVNYTGQPCSEGARLRAGRVKGVN